MMRRTPTLAALLILAAILLAPVAQAGTPEQDLGWLNAKRAANGLPGDVTLNPDWSAKCARHIAYMRATDTVTHAEDPASPHYSDDGNWAGTHAVLASSVSWNSAAFIWETAPLHMAQLLSPQLAQVGIADDGQFVCVTTWPGYLRPLPPTTTILTYPGNGASIYPSEVASEWPLTPGQALGLPTPTGPHLYVYEFGPAAQSGEPVTIANATLTGADGPVAVRWVDTANPTVGQYLGQASGIVIPVDPLQADSAYLATVTFTNGAEYAWGFSTALSGSAAQLKGVRIIPLRSARQRHCLRSVAGTCGRWSVSYANTIAISGRFTDAGAPAFGVPGAEVGVAFDGAEQTLGPTGSDGRFASTYRFRSHTRRFSMIVTLRGGTQIGAYQVHFRLVSRPHRGTIAQVYGVQPTPLSLARHPR